MKESTKLCNDHFNTHMTQFPLTPPPPKKKGGNYLPAMYLSHRNLIFYIDLWRLHLKNKNANIFIKCMLCNGGSSQKKEKHSQKMFWYFRDFVEPTGNISFSINHIIRCRSRNHIIRSRCRSRTFISQNFKNPHSKTFYLWVRIQFAQFFFPRG